MEGAPRWKASLRLGTAWRVSVATEHLQFRERTGRSAALVPAFNLAAHVDQARATSFSCGHLSCLEKCIARKINARHEPSVQYGCQFILNELKLQKSSFLTKINMG